MGLGVTDGIIIGPPASGGGGGTGTVTSVTTGDASPLFTTSVATGTTTPAVSFAVSNAVGRSVLGNVGATSAMPAYTTDPVVLTVTANSMTANSFTGTLNGNANTANLATTALTGNNLPGGTTGGDLPYQSASGVTSLVTGNITTTPKVLVQTGNGTVSAAPVWTTPVGTGSPVLSTSPTVAGTWTFTVVSSTTVSSARLRTTGTAPTIAAGTGAGTTPTIAIVAGSTNQSGQITLTAGTPTVTGIIGTITFNGTLSPAPMSVVLMPGNAATALVVATIFCTTPTTTTWTFSTGATALIAGGSYAWYYWVV